jgi:hypothetical protein
MTCNGGNVMRLALLTLFLYAGVSVRCQSVAPAPKTPETAGERPQGAQLWTDCKRSAPDLSISSLALRKGERPDGAPATWHWEAAQVDSKNIFHPSPLNSAVQSRTLVAQNGEPSFYHMPSRQWPNAKSEPIPTQWPLAKFERIPTEWPSLKIMPITSRPTTPATTRVPLK